MGTTHAPAFEFKHACLRGYLSGRCRRLLEFRENIILPLCLPPRLELVQGDVDGEAQPREGGVFDANAYRIPIPDEVPETSAIDLPMEGSLDPAGRLEVGGGIRWDELVRSWHDRGSVGRKRRPLVHLPLTEIEIKQA